MSSSSVRMNTIGIDSLVEKVSVESGDVLVIEDASDGFKKKKVKIENVLSQGTSSINRKSVDNNYTVLVEDDYIFCNSASDITVTLIAPNLATKAVTIVNTGTGKVTITGTGISKVITTPDAIKLMSSGTNYYIV